MSNPQTPLPPRGNEKAKLIVMGVVLIFVAIAYVAAKRQESKHLQAEGGQLTQAPQGFCHLIGVRDPNSDGVANMA